MKTLFKSIFWHQTTAGVLCAGAIVGAYFVVRKAYPVKDNQVQSSSQDPSGSGYGPRRERTRISLPKREISSTIEEIASSYHGRDKERMLFDFLKIDLGNHANLVFRYSVEKNNSSIAEALGHCLGCLGTGNWIPWIKELTPDERRDEVVRGYIRGLGSISPLEIESAIEMLGYEKNDPIMWRFALLELGQNGEIKEDFVFDLISRFPGVNFSDSQGFRKAIKNMIDNNDIQSLEKLLFEQRFKDLGETCSGVIGTSLAEKDLNLAMRWSISLKNLSAREEGVGAAIKYHLTNNRSDEEIVALIDKFASKNLPRGNMIRIITTFKGSEDPSEAARFIESLPPDKSNLRHYANLTQQWYKQDGLAASKWVADLPLGKEKDAAIMVLMSELADDDPTTARSWADSIGNGDLKAKALRAVEMRQQK